MTSKQINEIEQAAKEGKRIQFKECLKNKWVDINEVTLDLIKRGEFHWSSSFEWRIAPSPVTVPLGPEDIDLHRDEFRYKNRNDYLVRISVERVCTVGIVLAGDNLRTWENAKEMLERSRDNGKTWQPCSKELK